MKEYLVVLESGKRPKPSLRKEMVRIVVSAMVKRGSARMRSATEVGKKIVSKYPQCLQDVISGDVIGPGYSSLVKQIKNRIDNVKRSSTPKIRKRRAQTTPKKSLQRRRLQFKTPTEAFGLGRPKGLSISKASLL